MSFWRRRERAQGGSEERKETLAHYVALVYIYKSLLPPGITEKGEHIEEPGPRATPVFAGGELINHEYPTH